MQRQHSASDSHKDKGKEKMVQRKNSDSDDESLFLESNEDDKNNIADYIENAKQECHLAKNLLITIEREEKNLSDQHKKNYYLATIIKDSNVQRMLKLFAPADKENLKFQMMRFSNKHDLRGYDFKKSERLKFYSECDEVTKKLSKLKEKSALAEMTVQAFKIEHPEAQQSVRYLPENEVSVNNINRMFAQLSLEGKWAEKELGEAQDNGCDFDLKAQV